MYKFKIGDKIVFKDTSAFELCGKTGIIKKRKNDNGMRYEIIIDNPDDIFSHYIISESNLELLDVGLLKERNRLKEEMRLAHLEIDPFGEENW